MNYSDFDTRVGELKQAAVDAYMRGRGWVSEDDLYILNPGTTVLAITRPGPSGSGGGEAAGPATESVTEEFTAAFNQIYDEIDALVFAWSDLPDPEGVTPVIASCRQTTQRLSGAAAASAKGILGAGEIASYLKLIDQNTATLSGLTIATFKAKFLAHLGIVIGGLHTVSLARGANISAQQGIWLTARKNVMTVLTKARDSMRAIGNGKTESVSAVLDVAGWAGRGLALFASSGVSVAVEVANLGISILSDTNARAARATYKAATYDEAMRGLGTALDQLNGQIKDEERAIAANAEQNLASVRNSKSSYDLTQPPVATSDGIIVLDRPLVDEIVKVYLPEIAAELEDIAAKDRDCDASSRVVRSSELGLSATGPSNSIRELNWQLYKLLKDLAWEVDNGARVLSLAIADLMDEDENAAAELVRLANQIAQGAPNDPWR